MRRRYRRINNLFLLLIFTIVGIGLGYAFLTQDLTINGITKFKGGTWDIHFENIKISDSSVTLSDGDSPATINISDDTLVEFTVTLKEPGDFYEFTVDAVNDGSLNGMVAGVITKLNGTEISNENPLPPYFAYSVTYDDDMEIAPNHILEVGERETYKVIISYNMDIDVEQYPSSDQSYGFSFGVTYTQSDKNAVVRPNAPMLKPVSYECNEYNGETNCNMNDTSAFRSYDYRQDIKTITFDNEIHVPNGVIASWDIGVNENRDVMAYITLNASDSSKYDLYIQGDGALLANPDSSYWFARFDSLTTINNIEVLNTTKVTNMRYMFYDSGNSYTPEFYLNLGTNFDTSKVTDMSYMFYYTGAHSYNGFSINLGTKFDTSNVTNMDNMFYALNLSGASFDLDLGNKFDTSNVTNMRSMFGIPMPDEYGMSLIHLNLGSHFDTSKVTNMVSMFEGQHQLVSLDLGSHFDTSKVTDMRSMFSYAGDDSTTFTLNLGNKFDTSKVTDMNKMFYRTGYYSEVFTLDLGNLFDTSKVTYMNEMFKQAGFHSTVFTLNLGTKFDTSSVTNMVAMFGATGYSSTVFTLDLGNLFDTSKVTTMNYSGATLIADSPYLWSMFGFAGYSNPNFTLNLGSHFDTSKVTEMNYMFSYTGYSNPNFELDLSTITTKSISGNRYIFEGFKSTNTIWVKNAADQTWVINNKGNADLSTSNVLIKGS